MSMASDLCGANGRSSLAAAPKHEEDINPVNAEPHEELKEAEDRAARAQTFTIRKLVVSQKNGEFEDARGLMSELAGRVLEEMEAGRLRFNH
jgi:hypothetical protein